MRAMGLRATCGGCMARWLLPGLLAILNVAGTLSCARHKESSHAAPSTPPPSASPSIAVAGSASAKPAWHPFVGNPVRSFTLLYTADEHGWLVPHGNAGGAVALLAQWLRAEHLCLPNQASDCQDSDTLAISGGDNWTGPAISSFFQGRPMAEAMRAMGYLTSAMGNHELDFGQETLANNARLQGYDFIGANVHWTEGHALPIRPMVLTQRNGIRIAVVGLSTTSTPTHLLPTSSEGLTFEDEEQTLTRVIPEAWNTGCDVVLVAAHVCPNVLEFIIGRHPEWKIAFAGAGHCHQLKTLMAGNTPVLEASAELKHYVHAQIKVDVSRAQQDRVTDVQAHVVEIGAPPSGADVPEPVAHLKEHVAQWQALADETLGEVVGYTENGMTRESPAMVRWLLGAWRKQTRTQVAIMNRAGMRQDLAPGEIRISAIHSILPFNDKLVVLKLKGSDLLENATCCNALIDGMTKMPSGWVLSGGRKVDPDATYDVVTPDFAYYGGNGFKFHEQVPDAKPDGDWRTPIVDWMRAHKTGRGRPLENIVFQQ
jgi:5'-nucleotidase / UDP-sugar diphosphatase